MDDKVTVSIHEIENGYVIDRSWCTKSKGKDSMMNMEHHSEQFYMKTLPTELAKMFNKGSAKQMESEKESGFAEANKKFIESSKKKKEMKEEE